MGCALPFVIRERELGRRQPAREHRPSARSATAAIAESVEILQGHLEFVLDERLGLRLFAAPVALEVSYEGSSPAEDELVLCLVRAVASSHGGTLIHEEEPGGRARLSLSLVLD